ncbi:HAMP domain-containing histidine kinase [Psychromonas sp.]|nr:HAMP domain-containing histidine kinase [Psychromonas sp.]
MTVSLYQRMTIALVLLFITITCLFSLWSAKLEETARDESGQRLHLTLAEHLGHDNPLLKEGVYDLHALKNLFHSLMILGPSFEFYFVAPNGNIVSYSAEPGKIKRDQINIAPLVDFINQKKSLPIYGDDPRNERGQKIFSASPIYNGNNLQGYLYIIIGGEKYDSILADVHSEQSLSHSMAFLLAAVILFFLVLLALLRYLTHPLKLLTENIRAFKKAGFEKSKIKLQNWPAAKHNEIHELGQAFNEMAEQINYQFVQLQSNDKTRREMLTDLSHDLRTPLAALQGYLETIQLKGRTLSDEQHQRFIDIAFKNANQLKKLVDQIFELAHLDGGQVSIQQESFPVAELLHDIVAKFQHRIQEKKITLKVEPEECHFMVYTDIGKLERVLSNLIDNAIRHTDVGGQVVIEVNEKDNNKLNIAVIDNGTGIHAKELAYIFDARYRASNAICDNKEHGGLGLAITQKLLLLLKSDIQVESQIGKGTTFHFSLSKTSQSFH